MPRQAWKRRCMRNIQIGRPVQIKKNCVKNKIDVITKELRDARERERVLIKNLQDEKEKNDATKQALKELEKKFVELQNTHNSSCASEEGKQWEWLRQI
eukprot:761063-Hanusia_phi.AAC.2